MLMLVAVSAADVDRDTSTDHPTDMIIDLNN